jgi:hypothetical protein
VYIPSFAVNLKMVEATMPPITLEQRAATGRDDRPNNLNPIIFTFKLRSLGVDPGWLIVRGPADFVFREDCLEDVETRGTVVFGEDPRFVTLPSLPPQYTEWVQGVLVRSCRGTGPDARLWIDPGITPGFQPEEVYPFRIRVFANPTFQPTHNVWTVEFNGESSDPFEGFTLWTFTRTSLSMVSTARSSPVTGETPLDNPLTMTFRPTNTITGAGMKIRVKAPVNFEIARDALQKCRLIVQPISADGVDASVGTPKPNYIGPPSLVWEANLLTRLVA